MKFRITIFFCLAMLSSQLAWTQSDTTFRHYGLGFHVSMNASRVTGTNFSGINKVGLYTGAYFQWHRTDRLFGFEIDASYSQKGTLKPPNHKKNDYTKFLMKLDYAQLEGMLRLNIKDIIYEAGLGGGYLLSALETNENNQIITENGEFSPVEIFAIAGVHFPLGNKLGVRARLSHSILPIRKHTSGGTFRLNRGQFSQTISFMLCYTILQKRNVVQ